MIRKMEIGEFHWRDGIYFKREADGGVRLRVEHGNPTMLPVKAFIPPNEWASIVAHVSASGENSESYTAAQRQHDGA